LQLNSVAIRNLCTSCSKSDTLTDKPIMLPSCKQIVDVVSCTEALLQPVHCDIGPLVNSQLKMSMLLKINIAKETTSLLSNTRTHPSNLAWIDRGCLASLGYLLQALCPFCCLYAREHLSNCGYSLCTSSSEHATAWLHSLSLSAAKQELTILTCS
jgi:hypothetical protein